MTEAAIFKLLFPPNGSIPVERIDRIQEIRSHIAALFALAQREETTAKTIQQEGYDAISGAIYTTPPEVQQKIEQVILPADPPALLEAKPKDDDQPYIDNSDATPKILKDSILSEHSTIRNSQIVEKVLLTPEQKAKILGMHAAKKSYGEIKQALGIDGRRVVGVIRGQEQRMAGESMNFTDTQVLTLVRTHPGLNLYQLEKKAKEEMGRWPWTIGKIQKAVGRLEAAKRIETESVVQGGRACVLVRCKN